MVHVSRIYELLNLTIFSVSFAYTKNIRKRESEKLSLLEPVATHHPLHLEAKDDHFMRPFNANFLGNDGRLGNTAIQTNKFWWNWIVENSKVPYDRRSPQGLTHPIFPQPYALQWVKQQRLGVSHEPQEFVFAQANVDNNWPEKDGMRSYSTTIRHTFQIGATTMLNDDEYSFTHESSTGVHVQLGSGSQKITFPIFSGMSYVTARYEGELIPKFFRGFYFLHGACMVQNGVFEATYGSPIPDEKMYTIDEHDNRVEKANLVYRFYLITPSGDFADESYRMIAESGELHLNKPFNGYVRVAQVGGYEMESCDDQCLDRLTESAPAILWDVEIDVRDGGILEYSFIQPDEIAETKDVQILHWAYATHVALLADSGVRNDEQTEVLGSMKIKAPSKGWMTAVVGNKWNMVTEMKHVSNIDFLPTADIPASKVNELKNLASEQVETFYADPHRAFNWPYEGHSTYYFGGKGFQKVSMVCLVAKQLLGPDDQVVQKCISILRWGWSCVVDGVEDGLEVPRWGCGGRPKDMIYDTTWGGTPSSDGYNQNCGADFGNPCYNDHHYHYGYWITSAAMAVHLSPEMLDNIKFNELVNIWIRNTMNPSQQDSFFPTFRSFDLFDLHSWSRGLPHNGDGKDQESTSEEINLYYGVHLWGKVTGNTKLQKLAQTILSLNIATIKEFFLFKRDNPHHPSKYARNHVSGMLFQRSVQFATWFGLRKEYVHGIQMLPLTPALQLARTHDFCLEEWEDVLENLLDNGFGGNKVNSQWKSIVLTGSQAMIEDDAMRDEAYQSLRSLPTNQFDDGLTKVWALYWTATQKYQGDRRTLKTSIQSRAMDWQKRDNSTSKHSVNNSMSARRLLTTCDIFKNSRYDLSGHQTFAYPQDGVTSVELCEAKCLDLGSSVCRYFNYREGVSCQMGAESRASYSDNNVVSGKCHGDSPIDMCVSTAAPTNITTSTPTSSPTSTNSPTSIVTFGPTKEQNDSCDRIPSHHFNLDLSCIHYRYNVPSYDDCEVLCRNEIGNCKYINYVLASKACSMSCELKEKFPSGPYGAFPNSGEQDAGICTITATNAPTSAVTMTVSPTKYVPTTYPTSIVTATPTSIRKDSCDRIPSHHFNLDLSCIHYRYNVPKFNDCEVLCQHEIDNCRFFNYVSVSRACSMSCELKEKYPSESHGAFPNSGEQDAGICFALDK